MVEQDTFITNFHLFTSGVLQSISWNNVLVAGGSVLSSHMNIPDENRKWAFFDSDIDLFIYGLTPAKRLVKSKKYFLLFNQILLPLAKSCLKDQGYMIFHASDWSIKINFIRILK